MKFLGVPTELASVCALLQSAALAFSAGYKPSDADNEEAAADESAGLQAVKEVRKSLHVDVRYYK